MFLITWLCFVSGTGFVKYEITPLCLFLVYCSLCTKLLLFLFRLGTFVLPASTRSSRIVFVCKLISRLHSCSSRYPYDPSYLPDLSGSVFLVVWVSGLTLDGWYEFLPRLQSLLYPPSSESRDRWGRFKRKLTSTFSLWWLSDIRSFTVLEVELSELSVGGPDGSDLTSDDIIRSSFYYHRTRCTTGTFSIVHQVKTYIKVISVILYTYPTTLPY